MMKISLTSTLIVASLLPVVEPATAQDRFGSSVAIAGNTVVVLKPTNSRGPAGVYFFNEDQDGSWSAAARLYPQAAGQTGEGFGRSLSAGGGLVTVASGDPRGWWAATSLTHDGDTWTAAARIPLVAQDRMTIEGELDLAGVMSILQPPARMVATDGRLIVVSVIGSGATAGVRVFEDNGEGMEQAALLEPQLEPGDKRHRSFGTSLLVAGGRVFVGSPSENRVGAVYIFARDDSGAWFQEAVLAPEDEEVRQFGAALASDDGKRLIVGARGGGRRPGAVFDYRHDASGNWVETRRIGTIDGQASERFGAAVALDDNELWIGAPAADSGAGRVYIYRAESTDAGWTPHAELPAPKAEGGAFGSALALSGDLGVVGAPTAQGNAGLATVFRRVGARWEARVELNDGLAMEMIAGEVVCDGGQAAHFSCDNVDLLAYLPVESIGGNPGEGVSDIWGWTDPETGREYVLVGRNGGAAFVDITEPSSPLYLGSVAANRSGARDLKVYRNHLFFTGDGAGQHGLVVFDLTRLRGVQDPVAFEPDAVYDGIASAHNLILDPEAGYAYPVGSSGGGETCGGGLHMVDIRDPVNPTFAGCYTDTEGLIYAGRTHDGQCTVYHGPDEDYAGRQICFASNETALRIVDVTDKANPVPLAAVSYPGRAYIHQGWLTDDQRYFYLNDELDELVGNTDRTRTMILDVADLEDPVIVGEYLGSTPATDHNLYVKGDRMYQANYQAGLQVIDISDPENPVEIGNFDTTPYQGGNPPGFSGAWTAYPFFESGVVVVSSRAEGLFVLKPRPPELVP